jgi:hypothetical protein
MLKWAIFLIAGVVGVSAQPVIIPPPQTGMSAWLLERRTDVQPADMPAYDQQLEEIQAASGGDGGGGVAPSNQSPYRWGPFVLHPALSYGLTYSDGVQAQPGHPSDTFVQTIAPALFLEMGSRWSIVYSPTETIYSDPALKNTLGQSVSLAGRNSFGDLAVGFSQGYTYSSTPLIETGAQTTQRSYSTGINAAYPLGTQWSLNGSIVQSILLASGYTDTTGWTVASGISYQYSPQLNLGVGITGGYSIVDPGANLANLGVTASVGWHPSKKLSIQLVEGFERQLFVGAAGGQDSPTTSLSISYGIFSHTTASLSVTEALAGSYFANTATRSTGWNAAVSQRLLQRLNFTASIGQQRVDYETTGASLETGRGDSTLSYSFGLSLTMLKRLSLGATFSGTSDASSEAGFGFTSRQVGISLNYHY